MRPGKRSILAWDIPRLRVSTCGGFMTCRFLLADYKPAPPTARLDRRRYNETQSILASQETPMSRFWRHFISNGADSGQGPETIGPEPDEREALDAYSNVIVRVAE